MVESRKVSKENAKHRKTLEVQRCFIHCRHRPEDVMAFCRVAPHIRRIPHEIEVPENPKWRGQLRLTLAHIPSPYHEGQWDLFWEDIDKLLAASIESQVEHVSRLGDTKNRHHTEVWRWPTLLVTDSRKLVRALHDVMLRGILAEAARLKHWEVLPIILWEDFKQLCGGLVVDAPVEAHAPFEDEHIHLEHLAHQPPARDVEIGFGVYIQKRNDDRTSADERFGGRCVALFGNGRCAYCAVSQDGARGVECVGQWEVKNGVVVLACDKDDAPASHLDLAESVRLLHDVRYEEPVHLNLEEMEEFFEPPVHIAECIPRFSPDLRQSLLQDQWFPQFVDSCKAWVADKQTCHAVVESAKKYKVCILRPGRYSYKHGPLGINMLLHANGRYTYHETSSSGILKAVHRNPEWRVEDGNLVLDVKGEEILGFLWQKARQKRTVEQHVRRVEIPVQLILQKFSFEAFVQQDCPFPDHVAVPVGRRVGGVIDPLSCILLNPTLSQDRMPMVDFEKQLIRIGVDVSQIVSDVNFVDTDKDGNIGLQELQALEEYGREAAPPEVLHAFRQGLLETFPTLEQAWDDMVQEAPDKQVTFEAFSQWCTNKQDMTPNKAAGDEGLLKEWCQNTDMETLKLVFTSIDVERDRELDFEELETLHLHSAVLALTRVDHFCGFIKNNFGGNNETAYRRAYAALDIHKTGSVKVDNFMKACKNHLGYPYENAARAVFSITDRNFSKDIIEKEFITLHKFKSKKFLAGLEDLKVMVEAKCGGMERAYQFFLEDQKKHGYKGPGGVPAPGAEGGAKSISFEAFESVCKKKGVVQGCRGLDLKTVFIFLDEVTGGHANGFLTMKEFSLLHAFDARAVVGSPARLRKELKQKFGNMDAAFDHFYQSWLPHELRSRLDMLSLSRVMHVCGHSENEAQKNSTGGRKSNIVEQRVGSNKRKEESSDSMNLGRCTMEGWTPMVRREGPGHVASWGIVNERSWRLPGVMTKPKGWPKDDGGRKAQTPRAGTVSAIDWNVRC